MPEDNDSFGDYFSSFLEGIGPGARVNPVGLLRYRQGGDSRSWATTGGYKYLPGDWHMQCGAKRWTGGAATSGGMSITFPTPFADKPLVFGVATATTPNFKDVILLMSLASASVLEVYWFSSQNLTRVDINWLAIGPIGL